MCGHKRCGIACDTHCVVHCSARERLVDLIPRSRLHGVIQTGNAVFNDFVTSLDAEWSEGFQCQHCGPNPDVLVCDGTALGCRADKLPEGDFRSSATEPFYATGRFVGDPSVAPCTKSLTAVVLGGSGAADFLLLPYSLHKNRVGLHGKAWTEFKKYLSAADRDVLPANLIKVSASLA